LSGPVELMLAAVAVVVAYDETVVVAVAAVVFA
jgi:hypothetical protein